MRVLLVDDEEHARRRIARMLRERPEVSAIDEAGDAFEAIEVLERGAPDVLLLDVRMPELDGLALAQRYASLPPVIFITAYDEFAVRAFEVGAVDYLMKPVRPERLALALERARSRTAAALGDPGHRARHADAMRSLSPSALPAGAALTRVVCMEQGGVRFFDPATVTRFWSSEKYTVFLSEGAEHLTEEPLQALAERLEPLGFVRVHRAQLVRVSAIVALSPAESGHEVVLSDGQRAPVSRRSIAGLRAVLGLRSE